MVSNTAVGSAAQNMTTRVVLVEEVNLTGNYAVVVDHWGGRMHVRVDVMRGMKPLAGEVWIIDCALGDWYFAGVVDTQPKPVITGAHRDGTALASLLQVLVQRGLIEDGTADAQGGSEATVGVVSEGDGDKALVESGSEAVVDVVGEGAGQVEP